jgi:virginiamycin B lyase
MQGDIHEFPLPAPSTDVAEGPDGNIWLAMPDAIGRMTPQGAVTIFPLESGHNPSGLTADRDGAIWFTEGSVDRLGRISTAGNVTETVVRGRGSFPQGIVAFPGGGIWFTHTIEIGNLIPWGGLGLHGLPTLNDFSQDICVGPDKNLWFTVHNDRNRNVSWIGQLTHWDGRIKQYKLDDKSHPLGITAGPDGNLWFTDEKANRIGKLSVTGQVTAYNLPHQTSLPAHIVTGPDGNLWFTEEGRDTIGRITPEGKITEFPIPGGIGDTTISQSSADRTGHHL